MKWSFITQVLLIQIALPSTISVKGHKKVEREVNELVGRTNSLFSSLDYLPVCFLNQAISLTELCALYTVADALLVTSLRGGLGSIVCSPFPLLYWTNLYLFISHKNILCANEKPTAC